MGGGGQTHNENLDFQAEFPDFLKFFQKFWY